jgi:hypothetical protein
MLLISVPHPSAHPQRRTPNHPSGDGREGAPPRSGTPAPLESSGIAVRVPRGRTGLSSSTMRSLPAPMEVLLFPYLPLAQRRGIGSWLLIPRAQLEAHDCVSAQMVEHAHGVWALYRMPGGDAGYGCFVARSGQPVGAELDTTGLRTLHDAVCVSLLDQNPSRAVAGMVDDYNAGHQMCTTENALVFGHRFDADLYTGYETGVMVVHRVGGPRIGESENVIEPPSEMHLPLMRPEFEEVYAQALHQVITGLGEDDPDLPGAIRWLELAWTNSSVIDTAARILALRAGFDVLFGGSSTATIRGQLSTLLDEPNAARTHRQWIDHGQQRQVQLTDLEWWFQSFALLRNKIAHGGEIGDAEFLFDDGVPHHWHGEWQLRRAIKQTVANAGHPDVLLNPFDRAIQQAILLLEQAIEQDQQAGD